MKLHSVCAMTVLMILCEKYDTTIIIVQGLTLCYCHPVGVMTMLLPSCRSYTYIIITVINTLWGRRGV